MGSEKFRIRVIALVSLSCFLVNSLLFAGIGRSIAAANSFAAPDKSISDQNTVYAIPLPPETQTAEIKKEELHIEDTGPYKHFDYTDKTLGTRDNQPFYIAPKTYNQLMDGLVKPKKSVKLFPRPVKLRGEIRYHNMLNSSDNSAWDRDRSGLRMRVYGEWDIYDTWTLHGMIEWRRDIHNYINDFDFSRIYVTGYLGATFLTAGWFGWDMAETNIYDSRFKGIKAIWGNDYNSRVKYTVGYGETNDTTDTKILLLNTDIGKHSVEAGYYNYKMEYSPNQKNTILNLATTYDMGNYAVGAMYLGASKEDRGGYKNGYVLKLTHGAWRTWIPKTYQVFLKYYDQPRHTYIAHGMDGIGAWMHGFKGFGTGVYYSFTSNVSGSLQFYDLKDKATGVKARTIWMHLSYFF